MNFHHIKLPKKILKYDFTKYGIKPNKIVLDKLIKKESAKKTVMRL